MRLSRSVYYLMAVTSLAAADQCETQNRCSAVDVVTSDSGTTLCAKGTPGNSCCGKGDCDICCCNHDDCKEVHRNISFHDGVYLTSFNKQATVRPMTLCRDSSFSSQFKAVPKRLLTTLPLMLSMAKAPRLSVSRAIWCGLYRVSPPIRATQRFSQDERGTFILRLNLIPIFRFRIPMDTISNPTRTTIARLILRRSISLLLRLWSVSYRRPDAKLEQIAILLKIMVAENLWLGGRTVITLSWFHLQWSSWKAFNGELPGAS